MTAAKSGGLFEPMKRLMLGGGVMSIIELIMVANAIVTVLFGGGLIIHIIRLSYMEGQKDERLRQIEEKVKGGEDCETQLALMNQRLETLEKSVIGIGHDVKNLLMGKVVPFSRRRTEGDG